VLNYIPRRTIGGRIAASRGDADAGAVIGGARNDVAPEEIASHPPGCNCAVHRKKPRGRGSSARCAALKSAVVPRESGVSSTPQRCDLSLALRNTHVITGLDPVSISTQESYED